MFSRGVVVWPRTDSVINRMALYTIGTGLATCVLSCICLLLVHFSNFLSFHCDNSEAELIMVGQFAKYGVGLGVLVIGMVGHLIFSVSCSFENVDISVQH
jgi:hypothetical protein